MACSQEQEKIVSPLLWLPDLVPGANSCRLCKDVFFHERGSANNKFRECLYSREALLPKLPAHWSGVLSSSA